MKNPKKPTYEQRKTIQRLGLNPMDWLVSKDTSTEMMLVNRHTKTTRIIQK